MHHDVPALAVLAHHPGQHRCRVRRARDHGGGVARAVEGRAQVVAHAAVDGDVGAHHAPVQRHGLDGADGVQRHRRGPDDGAPWFDGHARQGRGELVARVRDHLGDVRGDAGRVQRHLARQVGDAVPAAEVHLGEQVPGAGGQLGAQREDDARCGLEARRVEDLAADVRVDADELELRAGQDSEQGRHRLAARDRQAELLVLVRCGDVLVAPGVHARGDADHDRGSSASAVGGVRGDGVGDAVHLDDRVDDDPADARVERAPDLRVGLVVAVQADVGPGHPGAQRDGQLAARRRVDPQPLLVRPAGHGGAQERLARVVHVDRGAHGAERGREGLPVAARPGPEVRLVEHVGGRAVLGGQRAQVHPADAHGAVGPDAGARRPDLPVEAHIRSGAPTPSRPRPLASTCRVASLSHRRVRCTSPSASSPSGVTRHCTYQAW